MTLRGRPTVGRTVHRFYRAAGRPIRKWAHTYNATPESIGNHQTELDGPTTPAEFGAPALGREPGSVQNLRAAHEYHANPDAKRLMRCESARSERPGRLGCYGLEANYETIQ